MSGLSRLLPRFKERKAVKQIGRTSLPRLSFAIKADTGMTGLAYFFSCSIGRLLLGRIAHDYFAIKMPGGVAENR
jgi:hypothetical protein